MAEAMRRRRLGRTKIELTELALGTWGLADAAYGTVEPSVFEATVAKALDEGVRTFDMAPAWGRGRAEETVAKVVGKRRDECTYITRAGVFRTKGAVEVRMDPESIAESLAKSLERLGTEYVDVLLLHDPPEKVLAMGAWAKSMAQFKKEGRIRAFGVSCVTADQARMALSLGAEVLCMPYNILRSDDLADLADELETADVGVIARSPLLHGLLTASIEHGQSFTDADHRSNRWDAEALEKRIEHVLALRFLAQEDVPTLRAAALRFVLANPAVTTVALGPRSPEQLEELVRERGAPPYLAPELRERIPQILAAVSAV
jgi:aryl-alcohol dehydrogenase-like predicted oxidoreductase